MTAFKLIKTQEQLNNLTKELNKEKIIAIDIECENNLHHYGAYISLIQISTKTKHYILDVLSLGSIKPFKEILLNKNIQKVFHDVGFDFRILNHQFNCIPKNTFDTQLAALLLGKEKIGLGNLFEEYFNITKEKKFQRVDWTKRPLSQEMLAYAIKDTAYLLQLKEKLEQELIDKNRLTWIIEENKKLESMDFSYKEQAFIDIPRAKSLTPKQKSVLKLLFQERNRLAKRLDKPPYRIISNKLLIEFAQRPPKKWNRVKGIHPRLRQQGPKLLIKIKHVKPYEAEKRKPSLNRSSTAVKHLTELRNEVAKEHAVPGHLLASLDQLSKILTTKKLTSLRPWQRKLLKVKFTPVLK